MASGAELRFPELSALQGARVLVTGGSGFLGSHICELLNRVGAMVTIFDIAKPRFEVAECIIGDLNDLRALRAAVAGKFVVFHVASPSATSSNPATFYRVNVEGTRNVIQACVLEGVSRLVHTSSASVVFDGTNQRNVDEAHPLPVTPMDAYTHVCLCVRVCVCACVRVCCVFFFRFLFSVFVFSLSALRCRANY